MKKIIAILPVAALVLACRGGEAQKSSVDPPETISELALTTEVQELPIPVVPSTLLEVNDRADYVIVHFWDAMDFGDTLRSHNVDFMEQNFANYISIFPHADEDGRIQAVDTFVSKAESDAAALGLVMDIAEKYLYEPNSPMFSEDYYILFLERFVKSKVLDRYEKMRPLAQLEVARKNRPGMLAADFAYTTRDGKHTRLFKTDIGKADNILLIFYDPDCDHCKEIIGDMIDNELLVRLVVDGRLAVVAVYSGDERDLWSATAASLPAEWIVGYECGDMQENGDYVLQAMPTMYLLDASKRVVLKDALPGQLLRELSKNS